MPFLDTRVRVQHPCPYCDLSVAFPDVELALWTSTQSDVFHVAAPSPADLQRVLHAMLETIGARRITQEGTSALVVTHQARWTYPPSVTKIADRRGLWVVPPTIYFGGWRRIASSRQRSPPCGGSWPTSRRTDRARCFSTEPETRPT